MTAAYSLALTLLVLGPLLGPGYLLLRDAVSTPRSYLTDSALGLGDAAPRAVPQDALLAVLSTVVDGGLLVKAILVAAIWSAGWGAAALTRTLLGATLGPQLVAVTLVIWNPYVAERLLQGHWSLLTGYAALPWIAVLATRLRATTGDAADSSPRARIGALRKAHAADPEYPATPTTDTPASASADRTANSAGANPIPDSADAARTADPADGTGPTADAGQRDSATGSETRSGAARSVPSRPGAWVPWAAVGGWLAVAGLTPTGSLMAGVLALLLVGRRNLLPAAALWLASAAPWLVATALSGAGSSPSDPAGVAAFAARAEPFLGTLGSLAGLGGIWNSTAVPDTRTTFFALIGTAILLALVATGVRSVLSTTEPATATDSATTTRTADADRNHRGPGTPAPADSNPLGAVATTVDSTASTVHTRRTLVAVAVAAIVLPALGATSWGLATGEFFVVHVPGAGLLRDTQKYVALAVPAFALCAAAGTRALAARISAARAQHHSTQWTSPSADSQADAERDDAARKTTADIPATATDRLPDASAMDTSRAADRGQHHSAQPTSTPADSQADAERDGAAGTTGTDRPFDANAIDASRAADRAESPHLAGDSLVAASGRAERLAGSSDAGRRAGTAEPHLRDERTGRGVTGWVAGVFVVLIFASLPDMAWGVGGALRPVTYPVGWERVAGDVGGEGDVAVLPGGMFRKFRYSGKAPVLDPAPRMLPRDVLQTGELPVAGATVSGEGARAGEVERVLLAGGSAGRLADLGVGWVLVERGTPGPMGESKTTLGQLDSVYADRDVELYRVPGSIADHDASPGSRRGAGAAHLVWGALLLAGIAAAAASARDVRRARSVAPQSIHPD
ncbi:hypothetical protein ABZ319_35270 [Nocardia sp. NPDC005978]|uniref:hypothetical protein n=1 Tax=Nocardia sp. NPDC005978 TaxID=3156725 RepID=UPI0033A6CBAE